MSGAPPAPAQDGGSQSLSAGEPARAFYHMNDHPDNYRFVRLLDVSPPEVAPEGREVPLDGAIIGLSTGWIPATVAEDWSAGSAASAADDRVLVRLHGQFADVYQPVPVDGMYWRVKRSLVRPMGASQKPPELSLLVVRWWDYWNPKHRRSRSHNVANEEMLMDVLQEAGSPHAAFGEKGEYEVHSAFIRNSKSLSLIGKTLLSAMRGRCRAALYFLWPTQRMSVERTLAGAVSESALFELMARMEEGGLRTGWPHARALYSELSGKLWIPKVCRAVPALRVPSTVAIDCQKFGNDPFTCATEAIAELQQLRADRQGTRKQPEGDFRGVVKLGFSWCGEDVRPFIGATGLVKALQQLLDMAPPNAVCYAQERIEDIVCELRFVCCRDLASGPSAVKKELVRMKLHPPKHVADMSFTLASHNTFNAKEAAATAFGGNASAHQAAEQEAARLSELWLQWFQDEGHGTPSSCRLDFLVSYPKGSPSATPKVWTVEVTECGAALCGFAPSTRATACFNECLVGSSCSAFPQALPPFIPEKPDKGGNSQGAAKAGDVKEGTLARKPDAGEGGIRWKLLAAALAALVLVFMRRLRRRR